ALPGRKPSEGPFETRTSIGGRCKHGNVLSQAVLIARVAWPPPPSSSSLPRGGHTDGWERPSLTRFQSKRRSAPRHRHHGSHSTNALVAFCNEDVQAGGHGAGATPVPIPNTAVKPRSADGTARDTGWESTSPPAHIFSLPARPFPRTRVRIGGADRPCPGAGRRSGCLPELRPSL